MPIRVIGTSHVPVDVEDTSKSASFYTDVLGLEEVESQEPDFDVRWFKTSNGSLIHVLGPAPGFKTLRRLALEVEDMDDVLAEVKRLKLQIVRGPGEKQDGELYLYILDPDGNLIEFNVR